VSFSDRIILLLNLPQLITYQRALNRKNLHSSNTSRNLRAQGRFLLPCRGIDIVHGSSGGPGPRKRPDPRQFLDKDLARRHAQRPDHGPGASEVGDVRICHGAEDRLRADEAAAVGLGVGGAEGRVEVDDGAGGEGVCDEHGARCRGRLAVELRDGREHRGELVDAAVQRSTRVHVRAVLLGLHVCRFDGRA